LEGLFPQGDWQLRTAKILESEEVIVLLENYEKLDDRRLRIWPCAAVWLPAESRRDSTENLISAIVLEAPEGAILEFSRPFDLRRAQIDAPERGELVGPVTIRQVRDQRAPVPGLLIESCNLLLDRRQISTPEQVRFAFGPHFGQGRGLVIRLDQDSVGASAQGGWKAFGTIQELEITHVDRLHLELEPSRSLLSRQSVGPRSLEPGILSPQDPTAQDVDTRWNNSGRILLEVTCAGPLRFDPHENRVTVEDNVGVWRQGIRPADQLRCDYLALWLENAASLDATTTPNSERRSQFPPVSEDFASRKKLNTPEAGVKTGSRGDFLATDPRATAGGSLSADFPSDSGSVGDKLANKIERAPPELDSFMGRGLRRIVIRGSPANLEAPNLGLFFHGQELLYDFATGDFFARGSDRFKIVFEGLEIVVPEMKGRILWSELRDGLGRGQARLSGQGYLRHQVPRADSAPLEIRWQKHLLLQPHENQHVLSLDGDSELAYGYWGRLKGSEIHIWLRDSPPTGASPSRLASESYSGASAFEPDRLLARGDVQLVTAAFSARMDELRLWFEQSGMLHSTQNLVSAPELLLLGSRPVGEASPIQQDVGSSQPTLDHQPLPTGTGFTSGTIIHQPRQELPRGYPSGFPGSRFELVARVVEAKVLLSEKHTELLGLTVDGNFQFAEQVSPLLTGKIRPVLLTGRWLHLLYPSRDYRMLSVTGEPAHVEGRGLGITAGRIDLSGGTNRLWIDQPGRMDVFLKSGENSHPLATDARLAIEWQKRMIFDGLVARFEGTVSGRLGEHTLATEQLEVRLQEPIRLSELGAKTEPQLAEVRCLGPTILRRTPLINALPAYDEQLELVSLALDWSSGTFRGIGPGRLFAIRPGTPSVVAGFLPGRTSRESQSVPMDAVPSALAIRFQRAINGNIWRRYFEFEGYVRAIYMAQWPWAYPPEPDRPDTLSANALALTCGRLIVAETPGATTWELLAEAGVVIEGDRFTARADRTSYVQQKDMLVLEGTARSPAELYRQEFPGEPPFRHVAGRILFWPRTKQLVVEGLQALQVP